MWTSGASLVLRRLFVLRAHHGIAFIKNIVGINSSIWVHFSPAIFLYFFVRLWGGILYELLKQAWIHLLKGIGVTLFACHPIPSGRHCLYVDAYLVLLFMFQGSKIWRWGQDVQGFCTWYRREIVILISISPSIKSLFKCTAQPKKGSKTKPYLPVANN